MSDVSKPTSRWLAWLGAIGFTLLLLSLVHHLMGVDDGLTTHQVNYLGALGGLLVSFCLAWSEAKRALEVLWGAIAILCALVLLFAAYHDFSAVWGG
jgi:hypothetical protein